MPLVAGTGFAEEQHHERLGHGVRGTGGRLGDLPLLRPARPTTQEERRRGLRVPELRALAPARRDRWPAATRRRSARSSERALLGVQHEAGDGRTLSPPHAEAGVRLEPCQGRSRNQWAASIGHEVHAPGLERLDLLGALAVPRGQDTQVDTGQARPAAPPRIVGLEAVALVRHLIHHCVGARPHRPLERAFVVVGPLPDDEGGIDRAGALLEEGPGFVQGDAHRPRTRDLDVLQPARRSQPPVGRIPPPANQVVADGLGVERRPVVTSHPRANAQRVDAAVGGDLPPLEESRLQSAVGREPHQPFVADGLGLEPPPVDEGRECAVWAGACGHAHAQDAALRFVRAGGGAGDE